MELDKRPCKLGVYLNTPTQKHGDERLPAKVLAVKRMMLTKDELNEFFDDKHAWDMLYIETKGKPAQPFWHEKLGVFDHAVSKFIESHVTLNFGLKNYTVEFEDATVNSLKFLCTTGGLTSLDFTIVCLKSNITGDLAKLDEHLNGDASVEVSFGDPDDEDEDDDEATDQESLDLTPKGSIGGGASQEGLRASAKQKGLN